MIILPGAIIGAPTLAAEWAYKSGSSAAAATSHSFTGIDFGAVVRGRNQKWALVRIQFTRAGAPPGVTVSSATIGGAAASIVSNTNHVLSGGIQAQYVVITARIDDVTTGTVSFSTSSSVSPTIATFTAINLDLSAASDSASGAGTGSVALSIDCPAGGGIIGMGVATGTTGGMVFPFANLTSLFNSGMFSASIFAAAQTALSVTFDPNPNPTSCAAVALSFPYAL